MLSETELNLIREYNQILMTYNKEMCENVLHTEYNYTETLVSDTFHEVKVSDNPYDTLKEVKSEWLDMDITESCFNYAFEKYTDMNNDIEDIVSTFIVYDFDNEVYLKMKNQEIIYEKGVLVSDPLLEDLSNYDLISEIVNHNFENLIFYDVDFIGLQFENKYHIEIYRDGTDYNIKLTYNFERIISEDVDLRKILENDMVLDLSEYGEDKSEPLGLIGVSLY